MRLRKGFVNVEKALFGGLKLRIPTLLFVEKMRTQSRFNVSECFVRAAWCGQRYSRLTVLKLLPPWQLMRMETAQQRPHAQASMEEEQPTVMVLERGGKQVHNASSKVNLVVRKMLLPLLDAPMHPHVVFDAEEDQEELDLLEKMDRARPEMLEDPKTFVQHLQGLLSRYQAYASGYSRVNTQNVDAPKDDQSSEMIMTQGGHSG